MRPFFLGRRGSVRWARGLAFALLPVLLAAGCSNSERGQVDANRLAPELLTIHPIVREAAPPCVSPSPDGHLAVGPRQNGDASLCLVLESAEVDARDLRSVVLQEAVSDENLDIAVTLNAKGSERFTNLAGRSIGRPLAIVSEGKLLAAPRVDSASTDGRFHISDIPRDQAVELVRKLGGDAIVPKPTAGSDSLRRATKLCENYVATIGNGAEVGLVLARTAGDITSASRRLLGHPTAPWDSLPADHFVASCSYTFPVASSTIRCPGGIVPAGGAVLIDDEGRTTTDLTVAGPC